MLHTDDRNPTIDDYNKGKGDAYGMDQFYESPFDGHEPMMTRMGDY